MQGELTNLQPQLLPKIRVVLRQISSLLCQLHIDSKCEIDRRFPQPQQGRQLNTSLGEVPLLAQTQRIMDVVAHNAGILT